MSKTGLVNCPACGAGAASDWPNCRHCGVRLATMACPCCFGMMFQGAKYCPHCASAAVEWRPDSGAMKCPHCSSQMFHGEVGGATIHECGRCFGLWLDKTSFDSICRDRERQATVLMERPADPGAQVEPLGTIRYRKCPICSQLMNRTNYARCSGVIIDACLQHGVWFDRNELQRIVAFIQGGGLDRARRREIDVLASERARLREAQIEGRMPTHSYGCGTDYMALGGLLEIGDAVFTSFFD